MTDAERETLGILAEAVARLLEDRSGAGSVQDALLATKLRVKAYLLKNAPAASQIVP